LPDEAKIKKQRIDSCLGEAADLRQRVLSSRNRAEHQGMIEGDYQRTMIRTSQNSR
jgi:hypothetical protein